MPKNNFRPEYIPTFNSQVFPKETNKIIKIGILRRKKYLVKCNRNGHMVFTALKDPITQIRDLAKLKDDGIITQEFEQKKTKLLKKLD